MLTVTAHSISKALKISTYHFNALDADKSDPFSLSLLTPYQPLHENLVAAIDEWDKQGGEQLGSTRTLQQLFKLLSGTKIDDWDIAIQSKYKKHTAEYKIILPYFRKPFQTGSQLERIQAVDTLNNSLTKYTTLAEVKTDVAAFVTELKTAYKNQKAQITRTQGDFDKIEAPRVAMCNGQFGNFGGLLQHYATSPEMLLKYFDWSVLSPSEQTSFTGQLKAGEIYTITKHTFDIGDQIVLNNTGNTPLKFYLAAERNMAAGTQGITIEHGKVTQDASGLGKFSDLFLIVQNTDIHFPGSFEIEL
jgi:hypothetical protein